MAKVTWLGEDPLHFVTDDKGNVDERPGPSFTLWNGTKFPKGVPVEITNPLAIAKAKANRFFEVEEHAVPAPSARKSKSKALEHGDDKDAD
jgi:hypothetical protein